MAIVISLGLPIKLTMNLVQSRQIVTMVRKLIVLIVDIGGSTMVYGMNAQRQLSVSCRANVPSS